MAKDPLKAPPSAKHPDAVFLMGTAVLSGVGQLIEQQTGSVEASFNPTVSIIYCITLILGGSAVLTGVFLKDRIFGITAELAGRWIMFAAAAIYLGAALPRLENPVNFPVFLVIGLGISSLWRARQCISSLRTERMRVSFELQILSKEEER